jgi:hypothetical protein
MTKNGPSRWSWAARITYVIALLGTIVWLLGSNRLIAHLLFLLALALLLVPTIRRYKCLNFGILGVALLASWSPIDLTFVDVDGAPNLVRCCPGAPYLDPRQAVSRQQAGECRLCTDIVGPTGLPKWYLVW